jgi:hypothetical protein
MAASQRTKWDNRDDAQIVRQLPPLPRHAQRGPGEHFGTCHRHPPRLVPFEMTDLPNDKADVEEMKRWPTVFHGDLCGEHDWKCEAHDCREPADPSTLRDVRQYCQWHWSQQPRGRAPWAA